MKMTKPSEQDLDAAGKLMQILQTIDARFGGPWPAGGPVNLEALEVDFDAENTKHLQALYNDLAELLRLNKNFYGRVIGGMCYVICYEENGILDPDDPCLELHPNIRLGLQLLKEHRESGDFLERMAQEARAVVATTVENAIARHHDEMSAGYKKSHCVEQSG